MAVTTSWLIGSYPDLPATTLAIEDELAASENQVVATGNYYVHHTTSALSAAIQVKNAVNAHANISDCAVGITASGRLKIYRTGAANFKITWPSDTTLRDFLGFSGHLTGADQYVAPAVSKWMWSPGRPESSSQSPLGTTGKKASDAVVGTAGDSTTRVTENNTYRVNEFWWRYVAQAKTWTTAEAGGEYFAFHDNVIRLGRQFALFRNVSEDTADTSTFPTLNTPLGPYKAQSIGWDYEREIANVDKLSPIRIPVIQVAELT